MLIKLPLARLTLLLSTLDTLWRKSAISCERGWVMCISKQRFYLLFETWIAGAGVLYKDPSHKRIITFDNIGQDRLYLLPAFWSHWNGGKQAARNFHWSLRAKVQGPTRRSIP